MKILDLEIENQTLFDWLCELVYGQPFRPFAKGEIQILMSSDDSESRTKEWFRAYDRLCRHFSGFMKTPEIRQYVVENFPKVGRYNRNGFDLVSRFFDYSQEILTEEDIIQILEANPQHRRHIRTYWDLPLVHAYLALTE